MLACSLLNDPGREERGSPMTPAEMHAALASWRDSPARTAIVDFLQLVTQGSTALPVELRVAAFDDDGTLAPERPVSSLGAFIGSITAQHLETPPGVESAGTAPGASNAGPQERAATVFAGTTVHEFEERAAAFLTTATHPRFGRIWPALTYAPMFELITLLRVLDFTVYVVSGSSRDFLRTMAASAFGAEREHVIGTEVEIDYLDGRLLRTDRLIPQDVGPGKPAHLWDRSGRVPLLAAGNTIGDLELLESARFALLLDHDDPDREYVYTDREALERARSAGWVTVSVLRDFGAIFSDDEDPAGEATLADGADHVD